VAKTMRYSRCRLQLCYNVFYFQFWSDKCEIDVSWRTAVLRIHLMQIPVTCYVVVCSRDEVREAEMGWCALPVWAGALMGPCPDSVCWREGRHMPCECNVVQSCHLAAVASNHVYPHFSFVGGLCFSFSVFFVPLRVVLFPTFVFCSSFLCWRIISC